MSIVSLLAPDFLLIALGYALRRWPQFTAEFWTGLEKAVYFVFFPALLFKALATSQIVPGSAAALLETGVAATAVGMALGYCSRLLFTASRAAHDSAFQCAFRFNSYIGFAVLGRLHADAGIAAMAILQSLLVPLVNVAAVWALAHHAKSGIFGELARNPLIIATLAGIACNASGVTLPAIAGDTLSLLAQAALPLGLISVGASVKAVDAEPRHGLVACFVALKLLVVPFAAWLVAGMIGLTGLYRDAAVLFAALPASPSSFILAARMGGDGALVARILTAQVVVAALTLPLWLSVIAGS